MPLQGWSAGGWHSDETPEGPMALCWASQPRGSGLPLQGRQGGAPAAAARGCAGDWSLAQPAAASALLAAAAAAPAALAELRSARRRRLPRVARGSVSRRDAGAAAAAAAAVVAAAPPPGAQAEQGPAKYPVLGDEKIMAKKAHGTSPFPVQEKLRWDCDRREADRVCSFNREYAEYAGYWKTTSFLPDLRKRLEARDKDNNGDQLVTTFYDSVTGKELFVAPKGRSVRAFLEESFTHGWPSFRDEEVNWENVRCLKNSGECVSLDGTHLGHNIPDGKGNRYCINLVSIAGYPVEGRGGAALPSA
ncbi:unnamed protein product [Prorocentrum cordatum]|uniref:Peptide-methionine (R)-S-oxide reductase n=1 Tax=Prorocentrum cordatum TaxID=2364126 RepID=A0ABN9Y7E1_9DINO|nr:unnamed protein product [Polarella glacialis]